MTIQEKIASVNKLERIDSSIESCIKILRQELKKRRAEDPGMNIYLTSMFVFLSDFEHDFNIMKNKK